MYVWYMKRRHINLGIRISGCVIFVPQNTLFSSVIISQKGCSYIHFVAQKFSIQQNFIKKKSLLNNSTNTEIHKGVYFFLESESFLRLLKARTLHIKMGRKKA